MSTKIRHAEIAEAEFAGLTAADALAQRGWSVRVNELGDRLRTAGAGIYIYENGLKVFEALGAYEAATRDSFPGRAREMRNDANTTVPAARSGRWSPTSESWRRLRYCTSGSRRARSSIAPRC